MLSVRAIGAQYGRARVLHDVSFGVDEGQVVSVIGANGAGKSTLVKVISGMVRPTTGQIIFRGEDITALPVHEIVTRGVVHVPEGRRPSLPHEVALENAPDSDGTFFRVPKVIER